MSTDYQSQMYMYIAIGEQRRPHPNNNGGVVSVRVLRMTSQLIMYYYISELVYTYFDLCALVYMLCNCCFALFVCLTLLASFFLPSHLSFKNIYMYIHVNTACAHCAIVSLLQMYSGVYTVQCINDRAAKSPALAGDLPFFTPY